MALLLAGLPEHVPGVTINRLCASGLEAAVQAARAIRLGDMDLCIAGGVESMTRAPWAVAKPGEGFAGGSLQTYDTALGWRFPNPKMAQRFPLESMGETAENVAAKYRIPRSRQDEFALRSHQRALAAQEAGRFRAELLPVTVPGKQAVVVERDEGPRADTSLEKLSKLKPAFRDGGTVTAGNSSSLNDGAAAILLASARKAAELGLKPLARVVAAASAGVDPREMGMGPVPATQQALKKAGLSVAKLDLVELNEAFAAQSLAVIQELKLDPERVNEDAGASLTLLPLGSPSAQDLAAQRSWRITVAGNAETAPHDCLVQVFDMRDPASPHRALLDHIGGRDPELSEAASHLQQNAQTYVGIASGRLDQQERIHPFQNLVSLFASALGAAIVDPAAAIVTNDPGEWADAMEQSLQIEKEMGALRR